MSKKKAHFYSLEPLPATKQNLATMHFFDRKERRMMSSVDVVLNLDYLDDDLILGYVISR
jgi:hypothetical protein